MSYAFGMKSKKRIDDSIKFGSIYTTVIMFVGLAVIEIIANPLSSAFGLSGETQLLCTAQCGLFLQVLYLPH